MVRPRSVLGAIACACALAGALFSCSDDDPGAGANDGGGVEAAPPDANAPSDGGVSGDVDAHAPAPACDPKSKFSAPVRLDALNSPYQDESGGLSEGDLVATWTTAAPSQGGRFHAMFAKRPSPTAPFGPAAPIAELAAESTTGITVSADGRIAVLQRTSPTSRLWISRRETTNDPWGTPELWNESADGDSRAHLVADGSALYLNRGDWKLYRAPRLADGSYGPAVELTWVTPPEQAISPVPTADELTLYFGGRPPGGAGPFEIYVARRSSTTEPWGTPELVTELNTENAPEWPTWTSPDGCVLWFVSGGSFGDAGSLGGFDLWMAKRGP